MTVADSLIYPKESDSKYPYTDTGDREFLEDKEFIETMILCAHISAVTTTLRLTPFVLKMPMRPPVLIAKRAALAYLATTGSVSASACRRGPRTSSLSAFRGSAVASGWTSAWTSCAA